MNQGAMSGDFRKQAEAKAPPTCVVRRLLSKFSAKKFAAVSVATIAVLAFLLRADEDRRLCLSKLAESAAKMRTKKLWVYNNSTSHKVLSHVIDVLQDFGLEADFDPGDGDWDVLYAHQYPFGVLGRNLSRLGAHQIVNHFPGTDNLLFKVELCTVTKLASVPRAFRMPGDKDKLRDYAAENPDARFLRKDNHHRKIKMVALEDALDSDDDTSFVQTFVERPLLVDGYFFDIGVYTAFTSFDPLRVYVYQGDALIRFCHEKYHPFDPENVDGYVIPGEYRPVWNMSVMDVFFNGLGFSRKESLNAHLRSLGKNPSAIWKQIDEIIPEMLLEQEQFIASRLSRYPPHSRRNFFELVRIDFIVDADMKVYLMEANLSPNLYAPDYPHNRLLYEHILHDLFSLVGIAEPIGKSASDSSSRSGENVQDPDRDLTVFPLECAGERCLENCTSFHCQLCHPCLSPERRISLSKAHREHLNAGQFKRIFPPRMTQETASSELKLERYSIENRFHYRWFQGKCLLDETWC